MNNRIQLRGISRSPSDLMTEDGGCAESINVQISDGEIVPQPVPEDVTDSLLGQDDVRVESGSTVVYIHKTNAYENYIILSETGKLSAFLGKRGEAHTEQKNIIDFGDKEFRSIASTGNLLKIATGGNVFHLMYMDGKYDVLGNNLQLPKLFFRPFMSAPSPFNPMRYTSEISIEGSALLMFEQDWNRIPSIAADNDTQRRISEILEDIRVNIDQHRKYQGEYTRPILAKYSLILYDGSEIMSEPFLVTGKNTFREVEILGVASSSDAAGMNSLSLDISFNNNFALDVRVEDMDALRSFAEKWGNVATGFAFYVSQDILPEKYKNLNSCLVETVSMYDGHNKRLYLEMETPSVMAFENYGVFNRIDECTFGELTSGSGVRTLPYYSNEDRAVRPTADKSVVNSRNNIVPSGMMAYNSRIVKWGNTIHYYKGCPTFAGMMYSGDGHTQDEHYEIHYFVSTESGNNVVVSSPVWWYSAHSGSPLSYLFYPERRCYKAVIRMVSEAASDYYEVAMKEHPTQNGAYFADLSQMSLYQLLTEVRLGTEHTGVRYLGEDIILHINDVDETVNKIYMSRMDNPFVDESSMAFTSGIIGVATTTTALSTGQFGQFPLYVFTEDGIHAVSLDDVGGFAANHPVSRDVALKGTISPIDQAIVFTTKKGVMLLSGSDIQNLSPDMNGRHWAIDEATFERLNIAGKHTAFRAAMEDDTPFMEYMADARCVYDYVGSRLIFFNPSESYHYVYMLTSGTWHKGIFPWSGTVFLNSLNSYPDALVVVKDSRNEARIYDFSTIVDASYDSEETMKGVIVSRPFDMDQPGVYKSLTRLFPRGQFRPHSGAVMYMLTGSNDGYSWTPVNSLRGVSWKMFRIFVLIDFNRTDRLSYIDMEYDVRFDDRPR